MDTPPPEIVLAARDRLLAAADDGRLAGLCRDRGVDLLTLHGSAARGEPTPRDLDVAVLWSRGPDGRRAGDLLALVVALVDLTGTDAVDVMDLVRASITARARGLAHDALPLYEARPGTWARQQMAALTMEHETAPLRRRQLELLAER